MAKRDPYFVPRRSGDAGGPLIRWTIILGLTAAGAAAAYHFRSIEQSRPAVEARETIAPPPQYASAPPSQSDAAALDSSLPDAEAAALAAPDATASEAQKAEPVAEPAAAPAPEPRPRPRRRPPPPPDSEPTPPPVANFPIEAPVATPTPPPPT